jgi:hypothetical protein
LVTQAVGAAAPAPAEAYTYDAKGNRVTTKDGAAAALTVVTDDQNRVIDDGVNTYTWTPHNALRWRTSKVDFTGPTFNSTWRPALNQVRLESVDHTTVSKGVTFIYDPSHRIIRLEWRDARGTVDRYMDGPDMVLEKRRVYGPGASQWARYVHGPNDDQPLAMEVYPAGADPIPGTGQVLYYHADAEGSVRLMTDANAQVVNRYDYDSFGRRQAVIEARRGCGWASEVPNRECSHSPGKAASGWPGPISTTTAPDSMIRRWGGLPVRTRLATRAVIRISSRSPGIIRRTGTIQAATRR